MLSGTSESSAAPVERSHPLTLERLAANSVISEDFGSALKYIDRRCRLTPPAGAHCFVLRAEAWWRLGSAHLSLKDLSRALAIAPHDIGANTRMLAWGDEVRRQQAAASLIAHDRNEATLRAALAERRKAGERCWAAVSVFDDLISGWAAWVSDAGIEVTLASGESRLTLLLEPDPFHPLASRQVNATAFRLRRPQSAVPQLLSLLCEGKSFQTRRLAPNAPRLSMRSSPSAVLNRQKDRSTVTVIVPVYGDTAATIACFESLLKATSAAARMAGARSATAAVRPFRILAVDDASPEADLGRYLRSLAVAQKIDLITNPVNLGFVGAVNRALEEVADGDVVLLNADTIVPPGFIDRLATAAHSAPDIGTVTPFSNNGDMFSFPEANVENPLLTYEQIVARDHAAAAANEGVVTDAPSGIGYCLYITRECLEEVGALSENFERGYLEDVDFCLRARAKGFRSVCAASVYVGHHGSRSFRDEKRALVLRNLGVLEQRFPNFRDECRAFEAVDPFRPFRANIERLLFKDTDSGILLAAGTGVASVQARARARQLAQAGRSSILLLREGRKLLLSAAEGNVPQSIALEIDSDDALSRAADLLERFRGSRLELIDPAPSPRLIELAGRLKLEVHLWVTAELNAENRLLAEAATRVLAPSKEALDFARSRLRGRKITLADWPATPLALPPLASGAGTALVVVPAAPSPAAWRCLRALAHGLQRLPKPVQMIVAGATLDDARLMSFPNVFVTGEVGPDELADVLAPHNPGWLLTAFDAPLFGHPLVEAVRQANRPVAYGAWSDGTTRPRVGDLAIAGVTDPAALAKAIVDWIMGR